LRSCRFKQKANTGVSPLRRKNAPPVEMTGGMGGATADPSATPQDDKVLKDDNAVVDDKVWWMARL